MTGPKPPVVIKLPPARKDYIRAENEFLRIVGLCVNTWAFIDRELYRIFRFILHRLGIEHPSKVASILYYKQRQIQQHIQLADEMLDPTLVISKAEYNDEWRPLRKKLNELAQIRNIIAHQPTPNSYSKEQ
jgi:hypothetical protein